MILGGDIIERLFGSYDFQSRSSSGSSKGKDCFEVISPWKCEGVNGIMGLTGYKESSYSAMAK